MISPSSRLDNYRATIKMRFIMLVEFNWVCKQRRLLSFHVFDVPEMQQIKGGNSPLRHLRWIFPFVFKVPFHKQKPFTHKKKEEETCTSSLFFTRQKLNGETRETAQQLGRQGFIAGLSGTGGREGM